MSSRAKPRTLDTTDYCEGFAPIVGRGARLLILGSLPGRRSLEAGEYYAHGQNAFWRIMAKLCGARGDYEARCRALIDARIAVWDVLRASDRPGSMDADIRMASAQVNDFRSFFSRHTSLQRVAFNGRKAEQLFQRLVEPELQGQVPERLSLPSTSPAYASLTLDEKLAIWSSMLALD